MPLYEYRCNQCGETFERMVRFSEVDLSPVCPKCASTDTKTKVSMAAAFGGGTSGASCGGSSCGSHGGFG